MKILMVQESDWVGRNPLQQHHLAELLSMRGHQIRVIDYELLWRSQGKKELCSHREVFENVSKIYPGGQVTVIRPGIIKIPSFDYLSLLMTHRTEIYRQIKEFKPDAIIGFGILNTNIAAKAAQKNNIPFLYHWLDVLHWLIPFRPFQPIGKSVETSTLKITDTVIVVSERLKEFVVKLGAKPERVKVVQPGISLENFNPAIIGDAVRAGYGIKQSDTVLFFMGWLYTFSGLEKVALEMAKKNSPNVKLLIVGEGDVYDKLVKIREEHKLQDRLILTGRKPYTEIAEFIAASDICLLPAEPTEKLMQDGLPEKLFEYMAMGKPVICTKLPAVMREFGRENGVLYVDRPEDVVGKALELVAAGWVKDWGLKARQNVEKYSWNHITDRFEQIITDAVRARSRMKA
jgi:glycosyltransferase involved in cell wall biosynthesis